MRCANRVLAWEDARLGDIGVRAGVPLKRKQGTSYEEATQRMELAVRSL